MEKVRFFKVSDGAKLPKQATDRSGGYDVFVPSDVVVKYGRSVIKLGLRMQMPHAEEGYIYEAKIEPRSGFSSKGVEGYRIFTEGFKLDEFEKRTFVAQEAERFDADVIVGKIDDDFRGEFGVIINSHDVDFLIKAGTRIAQMTFYKVRKFEMEWADELDDTERGNNGFGGSGITDNNYNNEDYERFELEETVLGEALIDPNKVGLLFSQDYSDIFTCDKTKEVYNAMLELSKEGKPIDVLSVGLYIHEHGKYTNDMYIMKLSCEVASSAHMEEHLRKLKSAK